MARGLLEAQTECTEDQEATFVFTGAETGKEAMFDRLVTEISDIHGRLDTEMSSDHFGTFVGSNHTCLESCSNRLVDVRSRLSRVQKALADPLWVVLLGRFSAGKSTLINAILKQCGGEQMRTTGLGPTDKQATVILHQSARTGLLPSAAGAAQVEGLSLILQYHNLDRLRPVFLVDTPGLLDEQEIDDALMEFVGYADIVLHCMTPDAELIRPDQELLEKRRKYFPSQSYHIVITKAEMHCVDNNRTFSETEWAKNLEQLSTRYSTLAKENLDLRNEAITRRVWLVDSITGRGIPQLVLQLLQFGSDRVGDVPRVREPVVRERFSYVCTITSRCVLTPLLECVRRSRGVLSEAKKHLGTQIQEWERTTLTANRDILRLEVQSLQISAIPPRIDEHIAGSLGLLSFLDPDEPAGSLPLFLVNYLEQMFMSKVQQWRGSIQGLGAIVDISKHHKFHRENSAFARKHLEDNAIPEYCRWFSSAKFGTKLRSLLQFESPTSLLADNHYPTPAERDHGEERQSPEPLNCDTIEQALKLAFERGMGAVIEHAHSTAPDTMASALCQKVRDSLAARRSRYATLVDALRTAQDGPAFDHVRQIVEAVSRCVAPKINTTVGAMRFALETSLANVRGGLAEKGVTVTLDSGPDSAWKETEQEIQQKVSEDIDEKLRKPGQHALHRLVSQSGSEIETLARDLQAREVDIPAQMALNIVQLENSQKNLLTSFDDWCRTFKAALEVFRGVESRRNFFEGHGIGDELAKNLNAGLGNVYSRLLDERRFILTQLAGCIALIILLGSFLIATATRIIPVSPNYTGLVNAVVLTFFGVGGAGGLNAMWRLLTFKRRGRAELAKTLEEQIGTVCEHSLGNLRIEEGREDHAYGVVSIALSDLLTHLEFQGMGALGREMLDQVRQRLQQFSNASEQEHTLSSKHLRCFLDTFCNACRSLLDETAKSCAERLYGSASHLMAMKLEPALGALEEHEKKLEASALRLTEVSKDLLKAVGAGQ